MKILNFFIFLFAASWAVFLIHLPGFLIPESFFKEAVLSGFRIILGLLLLFKLVRTLPALPLIFGMEKAKSRYVSVLCFLWGGATVMLTAGVFTPVASVLLFIAHTLFFVRSYYYSIEEIYFQNTLVHLPFLGLGNYFSADQLFGITLIPESTHAYASFFVINGIIMFSAGYQKFKSPLWQQGKGAISFLNLPHLVKKNWVPFISKMKWLFTQSGYLVMTAELFLFFSLLNSYFFIAVSAILIIFAISLFVVVDLSFIGQITCLNLLFLVLLYSVYPVEISPDVLTPVTATSLIFSGIGVLSCISIFFPVFSEKTKLGSFLRAVNGVMVPMNIFTERHQYGFYTCRFDSLSGGEQLLPAFDEAGRFGPWQYWRPRQFQCTMYPVTDYCLILHRFQKEGKDNPKFQQLIDICYTAYLRGGRRKDEIQISVKSLEENSTWDSYLSKEWSPLFSAAFENNRIIKTKICGSPPLITKTFRQVRLS